jgi:hypothetical protein
MTSEKARKYPGDPRLEFGRSSSERVWNGEGRKPTLRGRRGSPAGNFTNLTSLCSSVFPLGKIYVNLYIIGSTEAAIVSTGETPTP